MKKEPGSTAQYFLLIKELKDEVCILERQRRDIFCSRKIFANEFMASQLLKHLHIGRLELFYLRSDPRDSKDLCIGMDM